MTAHPQNWARDAAEVSAIPVNSSDAEFLAHVDGLERAARAMIEAGRAQIDAGNAQLESCRALRALGPASAAANIAGELVSIGSVAQIIGVSKDAVRMKVRRAKIGVKRGGRVYVHSAAIPALYA
ncbi:MAG TPA: hypothetical protein VIF88_12130 [Methylocystis sp.]|jgi:hypothetical protein